MRRALVSLLLAGSIAAAPHVRAGQTAAEALRLQQQAVRREGPPSREARLEQLNQLRRAVLNNQDRLCKAINKDFRGRSKHETKLAEILLSVKAIDHAKRRLRKWMRPKRRWVSWLFQPASAKVVPRPLGVVGIISAWNYPIQLTISPLVGALAAGNRVMIKPSEHTPQTSALLAEIIKETFTPDQVTVVTGDKEVSKAFAALPFDHLLFVGSGKAGKEVMKTAGDNLTPVTLELGGKSPTIIDKGFSIERASSRIMHGKLLNGGQTCVAPDYLLLPEGTEQEFVAAARRRVEKMYPRLGNNPDYTNIINDEQSERLRDYVEDARQKGAQVVEINPSGESRQALGRKIVPTLLLGVTDEMRVMKEEIFGPLLPIKTYRELDRAIDFVNDTHRDPLALYIFSNDKATVNKLVDRIPAGGVTVNDTLLHAAQENLPFGGIGPSGMGAYHGEDGFRTFSKATGVFKQSRFNLGHLLDAPYRWLHDTVTRVLLGR